MMCDDPNTCVLMAGLGLVGGLNGLGDDWDGLEDVCGDSMSGRGVLFCWD